MPPEQTPRVVRLYRELKRRRVFGSAAAYVVLAALLIELSGAIFDALLFPDWASRLVTVIFVLGFPVVVVLAWFFDISAQGLERTDVGAHPDGQRPPLATALQRSRSLPVPAAPVQRRRAAPGTPVPDDDGPAPDPARVRAAALGHMRHELRTPINGIIGYAEMLLEDVDDAALVGDLERIRTAGRRLLDRVDTVLRPDGHADTTDLDALAEQVRVDLRTPISAVVGYAELLMETCREEGRDALLADLERILVSARRLLELSEDIVGVATLGPDATGPDGLRESTALTRRVLSSIRTVDPGEDGVDGQGRLLVVDDNETNRDLLSRQLARHGYVVTTATNGESGLERLEEADHDLILLDVIMPGMNGVEMLARIQADERWADIPVIMLSSLNEVDSAVRCIEMGALDYVAKPVEPTLLEARIAAALEIRELRRREQTYRQRVAADADLIDRLLDGAVPGPLRSRVADGVLDVVASYPGVTAVRCVVGSELRPTAGSPDRVRTLSSLLAGLEALADEHGAVCLWRADGFLALLDGDDDGTRVGRAARLALAARDAFGDGRAGFGLHTGDAVGGVLGRSRPRFELWGAAVETAESLARSAGPGEVLLTPAAETVLRGAFALEPRGVRDVGGSQMRVHALVQAVDA